MQEVLFYLILMRFYERQQLKLANGILLQLFNKMMRNLRCDNDAQKTAAESSKNVPLRVMNESEPQDWNKENNGHGQLKISELAYRRKLQGNLISMREIFSMFSRIHFICLSKNHTLFLAFHLYGLASSNPALTHIPQTYRTLCCLFLAMKYEQIYHVELCELAGYLKVSYNLADYRRHERAILMAVGGNLRVETADRMLEAQFAEGGYSKTEELLSFYLLELCYTSARVCGRFKDEDLCRAIGKIVKKGEPGDASELKSSPVDGIAKLVLSVRGNLKKLEHSVYQKYQSEKYRRVASLPL